MKYLKLLANWLFLIVGLLPLISLLFLRTLLRCLIECWKTLKEDIIDLAYIFKPNGFFNSRWPWLVSGELWPLQKCTKKQMRIMKARKTAKKASESHPSINNKLD